MSAIDSNDSVHVFSAKFDNLTVPVYWILKDTYRNKDASDDEEFIPGGIYLGGGSGEHEALAFKNPGYLAVYAGLALLQEISDNLQIAHEDMLEELKTQANSAIKKNYQDKFCFELSKENITNFFDQTDAIEQQLLLCNPLNHRMFAAMDVYGVKSALESSFDKNEWCISDWVNVYRAYEKHEKTCFNPELAFALHLGFELLKEMPAEFYETEELALLAKKVLEYLDMYMYMLPEEMLEFLTEQDVYTVPKNREAMGSIYLSNGAKSGVTWGFSMAQYRVWHATGRQNIVVSGHV